MDSVKPAGAVTKPRGVFFDWDGTLVDTLPWLLKAHNHVRVTLGHEPWSNEEYKNIIRYSSRELYGRLYGEKEAEAHSILHSYIEEHHLQNLNILPGAEALLKMLNEAGVTVGLVSNKKHSFLCREVAHLGWEAYFSVVIGAGQATRDKPAGDPVLMAIAQSGIAGDADVEAGSFAQGGMHHDIWYVGDSETDMLAAQDSGCAAVLVHHHHDNRDLLGRYHPHLAFDDCHDFIGQFTKIR